MEKRMRRINTCDIVEAFVRFVHCRRRYYISILFHVCCCHRWSICATWKRYRVLAQVNDNSHAHTYDNNWRRHLISPRIKNTTNNEFLVQKNETDSPIKFTERQSTLLTWLVPNEIVNHLNETLDANTEDCHKPNRRNKMNDAKSNDNDDLFIPFFYRDFAHSHLILCFSFGFSWHKCVYLLTLFLGFSWHIRLELFSFSVALAFFIRDWTEKKSSRRKFDMQHLIMDYGRI